MAVAPADTARSVAVDMGTADSELVDIAEAAPEQLPRMPLTGQRQWRVFLFGSSS
jgi:hypothetical protein